MNKEDKYIIREMRPEEYPALEDFLYQATYVTEGDAPPTSMILKSVLRTYISDFGEKEGDLSLVAVVGDRIIGAVWMRITDYGQTRGPVPSISMSVLEDYRGFRVGTDLMKAMLTLLKDKGYGQVALSVQKNNSAIGMYERLGFEVHREYEEDYVMICYL